MSPLGWKGCVVGILCRLKAGHARVGPRLNLPQGWGVFWGQCFKVSVGQSGELTGAWSFRSCFSSLAWFSGR